MEKDRVAFGDGFQAWPEGITKALLEEWYKRALRSEMGLGEEPESGFYDEYYDLESDIVQAQAAIHGEY